jgi:AcrR family transcriptional regulator
MSPKITEEQKETRRNEILQAACKCFAEKGFHSTTMKDICSQSGLSTGAVYSYFNGKDELIKAIGETGRRNTRAALDSMVTDGPAPKQLAEMLNRALTFLRSKDGIENARLSICLLGEGLHTSQIRDMLALGLTTAHEQFEEIVREGKKRGEISPELDSISIARIWLAVFMGLSMQITVDPNVDLAACERVMTSLFNGTFTGVEDKDS